MVGKRAGDHALLVAFDGPAAPGLWTDETHAHSLSFLGDPVTAPARIECRVRYRDPRVGITFTPGPDGTGHIRFDTPQRALAPGQILALYAGEQLLGGGVFA